MVCAVSISISVDFIEEGIRFVVHARRDETVYN